MRLRPPPRNNSPSHTQTAEAAQPIPPLPAARSIAHAQSGTRPHLQTPAPPTSAARTAETKTFPSDLAAHLPRSNHLRRPLGTAAQGPPPVATAASPHQST